MKLSDALAKMEAAELRADHMPTTRQSYRAVIVDYATLLKAGTIDGPQSYIDFLADTRKLHWQTIRKALSPLHFFHVHVLEQLGHSSIETTQIYLRSVGFRSVDSPMDRVPASGLDSILPFTRRTA